MAKVVGVPDPQNWEVDIKDPKWFDKQEKLMESLEEDPFAMYGKYMDAPAKDSVVGRIVRFGVGDGYAVYLVVRQKPLTLMHIPYMDSYHANPMLLRGMRVSDIR